VASLILRSRSAKSLPALTPDEFQLAVETWSEVLDGEVPGNALQEAYIRAARDKTDGFPLGANDLVTGYRANCESERAAPRLAQDRNLLTGDICKKCHGSGWEEFKENGYRQVRKCDHLVEGFIGPPDPDADVDSW
jgi:hypothetical protein